MKPVYFLLHLLTASCLLFPYLNHAQALPFQLPKALMLDKKPIAPLCFQQFVDESNRLKTIDLKKAPCLKHTQAYNRFSLTHGFLGYELTSNEPSMRQPSIAYRYLGAINQGKSLDYLFQVNWSGGGTGFFTHLIILQLKGDQLRLIKTIDGGDRCFGGIKDATLTGNRLSYRKNATPQMLFDANNSQTANSSDMFQDCAVCCIGQFLIKNEKIIGFQFNGIIPSAEQSEVKQSCFNRVITRFGAKKKRHIDATQLNTLQTQLKQHC